MANKKKVGGGAGRGDRYQRLSKGAPSSNSGRAVLDLTTKEYGRSNEIPAGIFGKQVAGDNGVFLQEMYHQGTNQTSEVKSVKLSDLVGTQDIYYGNQVKAYAESPPKTKPVALQMKDGLVLIDGHHTVLAAYHRGKTSVEIEVVTNSNSTKTMRQGVERFKGTWVD